MASSGPGITDVKMLFARSGNQCAFPKCRAPMALNETLTGEICHIKGARPGSARYDNSQSDLERHSYGNLILMCPTHHTVIDDDEEAYTIDRLRNIKTAHETQSIAVEDSAAAKVALNFVQSAMSIGQSGGVSAHTINADNITVQGGPSTNHITHRRQMQAIEHLWQVIGNLSREFNLAVFVDNILTADELDAYFKHGEHAHVADCIAEYANMNVLFTKFASAGISEATKERPFVSHRLWSVFFVLQAVYGRAALLLTNSYKGGNLMRWQEDTGCDQLLRAILPGHVIDQVKSRQIGGLRAAIDYLEAQFLAEAGMNKPHA